MGEMKEGEVRIAEDKDFEHLKQLCDCHDGWTKAYGNAATHVYTKPTSSLVQMIKVCTSYKDLSPNILYDVLHDPEYRAVWDKYMLRAIDVGYLNPNNDVSYYAVSCPAPMKNRDFVLQRSWLDTGKELFVLNHSVFHRDYPPQKGFIRGFSYLTGYLIRPDKDGGSSFSYISHTDPRGKLPPWFVNKLTHVFAPKMIKTLHKAALRYPEWKAVHAPSLKPWLFPEQMKMPKISIQQCTRSVADDAVEEEVLDEGALKQLADSF